MNSGFATGLAVAVVLMVGSTPVQAACADVFKFEPDARVSANAISRLGDPQSGELETPTGGSIVIWAFDRENHPTRGAWAAYAVVYASTAGLAEIRPGGVLWANWEKAGDLYSPYAVKEAKVAGGVTMTITQESLSKHCPGGFVFKLTNAGVLSVNGARVGAITPE